MYSFIGRNRLSLCNAVHCRRTENITSTFRTASTCLRTQQSIRMLDLFPMNDCILSTMSFIRYRRCACRFDCVNAYILSLLYSLSHEDRYAHQPPYRTVSRQIDNKSRAADTRHHYTNAKHKHNY